jgi:hypothetical protein
MRNLDVRLFKVVGGRPDIMVAGSGHRKYRMGKAKGVEFGFCGSA